MSAASDKVEIKRESFWRKNTPEERARMQNERRKRKRKARSAKKEGNGKKVVLALEDDQARTMDNLTAKNERLLYLARKYYAKWQTLHRREQSLQKDESDLVKKNEQAQSIQLRHNKDAGVSADQPLTDINRSHLSHVKDPKSSDDQPVLLGCGVFGRCYKMYYRGMSVAVKQFNQHLSSKFDVTKEASLLKQLDHPCFPFVYGISVERKPYLLVLQFCNVEGKVYTLHRALHSHSLVLKNQEWLDIILQLLKALNQLHSNCMIHQDIKGDNILITYKNTVFAPVIIDFGKCIKQQEAKKKIMSKEEQEAYKQKYRHIAPEVVAGTHLPSHASDVYGLGLLLEQIANKICCKSLLSLSKRCLVNNPQARVSLDYLVVNIQSLIK